MHHGTPRQMAGGLLFFFPGSFLALSGGGMKKIRVAKALRAAFFFMGWRVAWLTLCVIPWRR